MENKTYIEMSKPRITDTRKMIISKIGDTGKFKLVELAELKEGDKIKPMIMRGGITVDSIHYLANVHAAITNILNQEGYFGDKEEQENDW